MAGDNSFLGNIGAPGLPGVNGPQMFFDKNFKNGPSKKVPGYLGGGPNDTFSPQGYGVTGLKDVFGMNLPTPGLPRPSQPTGTPAMSSDSTRTNANGVTQTGKQMTVSAAFVPEYANSSFNDLLAAQGNQRYQPFSSNQLPTTGANPFEGTAPKTDGFNPAAPGISGASYDNYGAAGGVAAASSTDKSEFTPMSGKESRIEGGSDRKAGGSLADALNDKAGINSYMDKFSSGDRQRAASSAFLNAEDSLSGLQARDAVNDVVYAGGQHYGRDGDGTFEIDRADARGIASGKQTAAGLLESYKSRITESTKESTPAEQQAPDVLEQGAKDGAFQQDKPMFSGSTPAIGGAVEFDNNNDKTLPSFGNNGGYKSGFKRIDTSMNSPFG